MYPPIPPQKPFFSFSSYIFYLYTSKFQIMNSVFLLGWPGGGEWMIIALAILVLFGAKKIPDFAKGLGRGIREFKDAVKDVKKEVDEGASAGKIEEGK